MKYTMKPGTIMKDDKDGYIRVDDYSGDYFVVVDMDFTEDGDELVEVGAPYKLSEHDLLACVKAETGRRYDRVELLLPLSQSECIEKYAEQIRHEMMKCYRKVLEADGRIQYKIYVYSDGEVLAVEQVQGDIMYLYPNDWEQRQMYFVLTVDAPFVNVLEEAGVTPPEFEEDLEEARRDAIDWLVDEYESDGAEEHLNSVLREAEWCDLYCGGCD